MNLARELELCPAQALAAFGAVRAVVEANGEPRAAGEGLLRTAAAALALGDDWRALPAASPCHVASAFAGAGARRALVEALLLPAAIEGQVTLAGERCVRAFADGLGVRSHWVRLLPALRRRRVLAVKQQLLRRSPDARRLFARIWAEEGVGGFWYVLRFLAGAYRNPALAARFHALGSLPHGTLGRAFFNHCATRGLAFPGERRGLPERMLHHDLMHVVNGYDTDAAGECELAGFYAAAADGDSFTFFVIALATFQLGLRVSPAVVVPARGAFDPERVLAAFLRGRRLQVDLLGPWDYWALMPLPLAQARARLGLGLAIPTREDP